MTRIDITALVERERALSEENERLLEEVEAYARQLSDLDEKLAEIDAENDNLRAVNAAQAARLEQYRNDTRERMARSVE